MKRMDLSEQEWKKRLTPEQYHLTREKGTETPFTGKLLNNHEAGLYTCCNCGLELFNSNAKFDSGSGWPSFDDPVNRENVELNKDDSYGMERIEVVCKRCGAHLGHLFPDGPTQTGLRYCINSGALNFFPRKEID